MGTSTRDRVRAHRARLRAEGKTRLSIALDPEARAGLATLRGQHPGRSIDSLINGLLAGKISLSRNSRPPRNTLPGNDQSLPCNKTSPLPGNDQSLPHNDPPLPSNAVPASRAELATVGHRWRREGATLEAVAARFNQAGWTPDAVPKRAGTAPRSDASNRWTGKATSQLLTRDYPDRD